MIGLDSNVLLRFFVEDDVTQTARAVDLMTRRISEHDPGFISIVVLVETIWNLTRNYEFSHDQLVTTLKYLLSSDSLILQHEEQVAAALLTLEDGLGSFPDALIASLGMAAKCTTTYTFDRKAARLPGFTLIQ